ncbi:multifunctional CCA addition/repair protein [Undibacterium sp. TJN19]|uniref:multifunctional CCA addition/repair protein n=1 Tax=Undibacterium sp. TJN19 TaxID=3413055 RepID=UPI003BF396F4
MKSYIVGGAVRDTLLGFPVQDRDFVVVGSSPGEMLALGYLPVGKDFPVFLHPKTREEYALARTERKTAAGYKGFVFHTDTSVTLEEDLIRRDLTINAMAQDDAGHIIDPFGGRQDLQNRVFRHVSEAFCEDPVRILRLARFAARFAMPPTEFSVAEETNALMQTMVAAGEVDALVAERVWQELSRGLMEVKPSRMLDVLHACGALQRLLPELAAWWQTADGSDGNNGADSVDSADNAEPARQLIDHAARCGLALAQRYAVLLQQLDDVKTVEAISQRLKVPVECRDLAVMTTREYQTILQAQDLSAASVVDLLARNDAFRKPQRFLDLLQTIACIFTVRKAQYDTAFPQADLLGKAMQAAQQVNGGAIASLHGSQPQQIPVAIREARIAAVAALLK